MASTELSNDLGRPRGVIDEALYHSLLSEVEGFFKPLADKPGETPQTILEELWRLVGKVSSDAYLPDLDAGGLAELRAMIERRREGIPLAYLTGRQSFMGLELLAGPGALIPRHETEIVGGAAVAAIRGKSLAIDVCTGSGNLALAMAFHEPRARVFGSDLSEAAVALARLNAEFTKLAERVEFRSGDLFAAFESPEFLGQCDVISCNPPYIAAAKVPKMPPEISAHEPAMAFNGGVFGVSILMRLVKEAPRFLKPGGALCFEVGLGQGPGMEKLLLPLPWVSRLECHTDATGAVRALVAHARADEGRLQEDPSLNLASMGRPTSHEGTKPASLLSPAA